MEEPVKVGKEKTKNKTENILQNLSLLYVGLFFTNNVIWCIIIKNNNSKRGLNMKRLEKLIEEKEQIEKFKCLSFELLEKAKLYYEIEIEAIQQYDAPNPEVR